MKPSPPVLFRFSNRTFLNSLLTAGEVRFSHARAFKDSTLAAGQSDDEQRRTFFLELLADSVLKPGVPLVRAPIEYELLGRTGRPLDYYLFCTTLTYDPRFYGEFKADACVRIVDPGQFSLRLGKACKERYPDCDFYGRDCWYYNPSRRSPSVQVADLAFGKDHRFAWQNEFRYIFAIAPERSDSQHITFMLGDISDICQFYDGV